MEYDNVLVLSFENAGIFNKYWKVKDGKKTSANKDDRVLTNKGRENRTSEQWIEQRIGTFTSSFIENIIRVFIGKRPVSKYRDTCVNGDDICGNIALRAMVKISSITKTDSKGVEVYILEKTTTRKCLDNSWGAATPSWTKFKYLLPEDIYNDLVSLATEKCGQPGETVLFDKVADILFNSKDQRVDVLVKKARENSCEPLAKLLTGSKIHSLHQAGYQGLGAFLRTMVSKGVSDICRLDGEIAIPLCKDEVKMFSNGSGYSSLFEGGLVFIKELINLEYATLETVMIDFTEVQQ
jgi:hypothetical protein